MTVLNQPVRSLVFDMGNVLIHFKPQRFIDRENLEDPADRELLMKAIFRSPDWPKLDTGELTEEQLEEIVKQRLPERLHEAAHRLIFLWHEPLEPMEGMEELIRDCREKGFGIYLLSNAGWSQKEYWPTIPCSRYFDGTVVSAYEGCVKPMPEIYERLLERYHLKASECCFIDDLPANVDAARKAGMQAVLFDGDAGTLREILLGNGSERKYDFETLLDRTGTDCIKWDYLKSVFGVEDLMPFWVADGDFPVLPEIREALEARCAPGQTFGYTGAGSRFYDAVIRWNKERHGLDVAREEILLVPGVVTGLSVVLLALTEETDPVLITPPVYTPFFDVVNRLGRPLVEVPLLQEEDRCVFDFEAMEEKMASGVKAFILCSPHNPTGRVWDREELCRVVELCRKYHVFLISDEIHYDLLPSGKKHIPIPLLAKEAVMLTAASKTFNIAGLKTSYIVCPDPALRERIASWLRRLDLSCNLFGLLATAAAYENGGDWVDEQNAVLRENAETALSFFRKRLPQVKACAPEGTYLLWLDFSAFGLSGQEIREKLVKEAGVALNPGKDYGKDYDACLRMNIAVPKWYLKEGLEKIARAFSA